MEEKQTDVLIIGGGLTGASLLLALQDSNLQCQMVDKHSLDTTKEPYLDARSLALAPASVRILQQLGVGQALIDEACAIKTIHISQQGSFGNSRLQAQSDALGHVIEMNALNKILLSAIDTKNIAAPAQLEHLDATKQYAKINQNNKSIKIHYRILVAADGAQSMVRHALGIKAKTVDYQQSAIVCNVALNRAHQDCAYERFTAEGPLAMLPLKGERVAMVWAMTPQQAKARLALSDAHFLAQVQRMFGYRLGRLRSLGQRQCFALQMVMAEKCIQQNAVCIGSAAQHLHPVAGQGFNLALRDAASLAQCLIHDGASMSALRQYAKLRHADRRAVCTFTNALVRLFSVQLPGASMMRALGLVAFDNAPFLQDTLARYARGFGGMPPDLACGLPLLGAQDER